MFQRTRTALLAILFLAIGVGISFSLPIVASQVAHALDSGGATTASHQLKKAVDLSQAFQEVVKIVEPSVVNISSVKRIHPTSDRPSTAEPNFEHFSFREFFGDEFLKRFFQQRVPDRGLELRGLGTGVIVSKDGYILTNSHVVRDADEVTVKLSDDRTYTAKVVGSDEKAEVAVVKIDASDLVPAELGDSEAVQVGEWVLAVGNPAGLDHTVTAGIISAKGRSNIGVADYEDFIQTDAAISPGNSGGPLVDLEGKVVGINTAIASRSGAAMGIGFAIPINMAHKIMDSLITEGHVERGSMGIYIQDLTTDLATSFGFHGRNGVLIGDVMPDSAAKRAGLRQGDIIVKFNDQAVHDTHQLRNLVASTKPGAKIPTEVFRDGKRQTATVILEQQPAVAHRSNGEESSAELGISVENLTPDLARQLGEKTTAGVVVTNVELGSLAAEAGIHPNDLITSLGDKSVSNVDEYRMALKEQDLKHGLRLQIESDGVHRFVWLKHTRS